MNTLESQATVAEALKLLTALEGSIKEVAESVRKGTEPAMAAVKADILASLWAEGNATLMRVEAITGPHARRMPFTEAYAAAMCSVNKLREPKPTKAAPLDTTLAGQPSRGDHLPRIELPKFSGAPSEWPAFSSRFEKRVVGLVEDADRYAFLAKCLERCDIARHSCEAFENAGMPFDQAWAKLEERFYKKRVAFMGHIQKIVDLPRISSASANHLMRVIDVVETSLASARQIAEANDSTSVVEDGLVVALVLAKLDADTIATVARRANQQLIPTWKELRGELDKLANQLYYKPQRREEAAPKPSRSRQQQQGTQRTVLVATTPSAAPTKTPAAPAVPPATNKTGKTGKEVGRRAQRCYACDRDGHITTSCPELHARSLLESVYYIMDMRKCMNCFSNKHPAAQCPSAKRCQVCGKKHHTLLHIDADLAPK